VTCRPAHIVLAVAALLAGCETSVDVFDTDVDRQFAVHGYLDTAADTQFVRVQALRRASAGENDPLDGVAVRVVQSGAVWERLEYQDTEGDTVYAFRAAFHPEPGARHDLVVERNGVQGAFGTTVVPPLPTVSTEEGVGNTTYFTKDVTFAGLGFLRARVVIWYDVIDPDTERPVTIGIPYAMPGPAAGDEREITLRLTQDRAEILRQLGLTITYPSVKLLGTGAIVEVESVEWGSSDPDPGMLDGNGFFASLGRYRLGWTLTGQEVLSMGLVNAQ